MKKTWKILLLIFLVLTLCAIGWGSFILSDARDKEKNTEIAKKNAQEKLIKEIKTNYNVGVIVTKDTNLYNKDNKIKGKVFKDTVLNLEKIDNVTIKNEYLKLENIDYYIHYKDIKPQVFEEDTRYKKYILFNENVQTKEKTNFYNLENKQVFTIEEGINLPLIMKTEDKYFVEYDNRLLGINKGESKLVVNDNSNLEVASSVPVLTYHFFYDKQEEVCDQIICLENNKFDEQLKYLGENEFLTLTMDEFYMFMKQEINVPKKSVLITIDDGTIGTEHGIKLLDENEMNATLFLVTGWNPPERYNYSKFLEIHSHTNLMHDPGKCPGGQGSLLKCGEKETVLNDLKTSREVLDKTIYFCYPFYEYNDYAISLLKEAGFQLAFTGGNKKAKPSDDKFKIPRYTILHNDSIDKFKSIVN